MNERLCWNPQKVIGSVPVPVNTGDSYTRLDEKFVIRAIVRRVR